MGETLLDMMRRAIHDAMPALFGTPASNAGLEKMAEAAADVARDYASEYATDAVRDHEERR